MVCLVMLHVSIRLLLDGIVAQTSQQSLSDWEMTS